jgi:AAA domain-containing protein
MTIPAPDLASRVDADTRATIASARRRLSELEGKLPGNGKPALEPVVVSLGDVKPERVSWLWPGRIPRGKLTLLDGDPGLGKSTVALDLAARVTTGRAFPDGSAAGLGNVVILTAEDGLADTVRPRLDAMGGNPRRVAVLQAVRDETGERPVSLPEHLDALRQAIFDIDAVLVIVDPFTAFLASYVNSRIDHDIRRTLAPLAKLAEELGIAVLLIRHLNKMSGGPALYRGGGSIGIIAAARAGLVIAEDLDDPTRRILAVVKANLAPRAASLAYRLEPAPNGVARVVWAGESHHTAAALLAVSGDADERSAVDEAAEFLRAELSAGPRPAGDLLRAARQAGHAEKTLRRAKNLVGVRAVRQGFGTGGAFVWALPGAIDGQSGRIDGHSQNLAINGPLTGGNHQQSQDLPIDGQPVGQLCTDGYDEDEEAGIRADGADGPPPNLAREWADAPLGDPEGNEEPEP